MAAPGYSLDSTFRQEARAESHIQSLIPWPLGPLDNPDLVEFRLAPNELREVVVNFDPTAVIRQVFARFQVANEYAATPLTGVLTWAAGAIGSNLYTGVGTAFVGEIKRGDVVWYVDDLNRFQEVTVESVVSDTQFVGDRPIVAASTGQAFGLMLTRNIPSDWSTGQKMDWTAGSWNNTGTVTVTAIANTLTGVGTAFLTELSPGDKIQVFSDAGAAMYLIVDSITDNTNAILRGFPLAAATARAYARFYTRYSDISFQLFDSAGRSYGSEIVVQAQQGAFGSASLLNAIDGIRHQPYFLGRREALILRIRNRTSDARRVHGHIYTVRILT